MNKGNKYEIIYTDNPEITIHKDNSSINLYRIRALRNFGTIKEGEIGGFVQSEENLSQSGTCWIHDNAIAYNGSKVKGNAKLMDNSVAEDFAVVTDSAVLKNKSRASKNSRIGGRVTLRDYARITGNSSINGIGSIDGCECIVSRKLTLMPIQY